MSHVHVEKLCPVAWTLFCPNPFTIDLGETRRSPIMFILILDLRGKNWIHVSVAYSIKYSRFVITSHDYPIIFYFDQNSVIIQLCPVITLVLITNFNDRTVQWWYSSRIIIKTDNKHVQPTWLIPYHHRQFSHVTVSIV